MTAATTIVTETVSEAPAAGVAATGIVGSSGAAVQNLLRRRVELPAGHPDRAKLRDRAIEVGLPLSRCLAARYRGRGEPLDDLYQVAAIGLIKAIDGYDAARAVAFTTYAVPCIVGRLKRHFRDTTWRVRVPRRIQELALTLAPAGARLTQQLGRSPTRAELAAHLGVTAHDIDIAVNAWTARHPGSLDAFPADSGQAHHALRDTLGAVDVRFDTATDLHVLNRLLAMLPTRERRILVMRFAGEMTQAEIAAQIGVSQMHVSRLLLRTLTELRTAMLADQPPPTIPYAVRRP